MTTITMQAFCPCCDRPITTVIKINEHGGLTVELEKPEASPLNVTVDIDREPRRD